MGRYDRSRSRDRDRRRSPDRRRDSRDDYRRDDRRYDDRRDDRRYDDRRDDRRRDDRDSRRSPDLRRRASRSPDRRGPVKEERRSVKEEPRESKPLGPQRPGPLGPQRPQAPNGNPFTKKEPAPDSGDAMPPAADGAAAGEEEKKEDTREKPNFEASGLLAQEDNSKNGIALKFTEPPEARKPTKKWRFFVFKGDELFKQMHLHKLSCWLIGKDRRIADIPSDHPTCSKQHAVLQFRMLGQEVHPYVMDLESTNGTYINGERIEPARYYQLKEKDVLRFGKSTRDHVLLHAASANDQKIDPALLDMENFMDSP